MQLSEVCVGTTHYTRKSFFVDEKAVRRARKALGVSTDAEAVRLSLERVVEMEKFWRFMAETRSSLAPGSIEAP
jgi:Arc/MetJ family transcription regulator